MDVGRTVLAIVFGSGFAALAISNGRIFIFGLLLRRHQPSWIPLIGGGCGVAAVLLVPVASVQEWWWVPLLLDWGSLPGIGHAIVWHLVHALGRPRESN